MAQNFSGDKDMTFCGVFDGHGPSGHIVARCVRDHIPSKLSSFSKGVATRVIRRMKEMEMATMKSTLKIPSILHGKEEYSNLSRRWMKYLNRMAVLIVIVVEQLRLLYIKRDAKIKIVAEQLTVDLKPSIPSGDVLPNDEVVAVVAATRKRSLAAKKVQAWSIKYPNARIDDCAVVCLFFKAQPRLIKGPDLLSQLE
ncbi:hypothetical protein Leryth_023147 [Lithospermum erythrorhizon]|nr:hypothetical protein Leryth_023147 [Lithospermum erythrorhizon]